MAREQGELKLYVLLREDLNMSVGKAASQASHAALYSYLQADSGRRAAFDKDGIGIKICLRAPNEDALHEWKQWADHLELPNFLVNDTGSNTHFRGVPTISALGIGPLTEEESRHLRHLKLYR